MSLEPSGRCSRYAGAQQYSTCISCLAVFEQLWPVVVCWRVFVEPEGLMSVTFWLVAHGNAVRKVAVTSQRFSGPCPHPKCILYKRSLPKVWLPMCTLASYCCCTSCLPSLAFPSSTQTSCGQVGKSMCAIWYGGCHTVWTDPHRCEVAPLIMMSVC